MTFDTNPTIARLKGELRARQAANPNSPIGQNWLQGEDGALWVWPPDSERCRYIGVDEDAEPVKPVEPVKRTRQRRPSVASAIRQMKRAGLDIAGCKIDPRDGTIMVVTGKPAEPTTPDSNDSNSDWDIVLQ